MKRVEYFLYNTKMYMGILFNKIFELENFDWKRLKITRSNSEITSHARICHS
jgi:hypothetical protein